MNVIADGGRVTSGWHARRPLVRQADLWGRRMVTATVVVWAAGMYIGLENALKILTLGGFAGAVWGLRQPAVGLLSVSLLCTLDAITRPLIMTGGLLRWNTLNYWFLVVSLLYLGFLRRSTGAQPMIAKTFFVLLVLQLAQSPDISLGIQHLLGFISFFGILIYFIRGIKDDHIWFWIGLMNGTAGVLGGMLFNLQRARLPTLNYNVWAFLPVTAMFAICLSYGFVSGRLRSILLGLLAVVNLGWVFLSGSRGDLFIAVLCLLFLIATSRGVVSRVSYLVIIAVLASALSAAFPELRDRALFRITKLMDSNETAESRTSGRTDLVKGGWHIFVDHPFGVGTGGFAHNWARLGYVEGVSGFKYGEEMAAHAGWIKILVENGLVGFAMLGLFVASFAATGWRNGTLLSIQLGLLVTVVLMQAFTSTEFQPKGIWFLAAGTTALLNRSSLELALARRRRVPRRFVAPDLLPHSAHATFLSWRQMP